MSDDPDDQLLAERGDRTADEEWRLLTEQLAPTDDELAHGLERAATRQRPDTDWRPLPALPRSLLYTYDPSSGSWRVRGGVVFTIAETRGGYTAGHPFGGWMASANGVPLMHAPGWYAFFNENEAKAFCDEVDLEMLGDFQL